jgi:hypothetical protein
MSIIRQKPFDFSIIYDLFSSLYDRRTETINSYSFLNRVSYPNEIDPPILKQIIQFKPPHSQRNVRPSVTQTILTQKSPPSQTKYLDQFSHRL